MPSFYLVHQDEERDDLTFEAEAISIGRDKAQDLTLDHPTVSRQHALIEADDEHDHYNLVVLSQGGLTAINRDPVETEAALSHGDLVHFGKVGVRFETPEGRKRDEQEADEPAADPFASVEQQPDALAEQFAGQEQLQQDQEQAAEDDIDDESEPESELQKQQTDDDAAATAQEGDQLDEQASEEEEKEEEEGDGTGIATWEEIAESEEARKEDEKKKKKRQQKQRLDQNQEEDESNPAVLFAAGGILLLVVGLMFSGGGGKQNQNSQEKKKKVMDRQPLEITVDCVETTCMKKAKRNYKIGLQRLKSREIRPGNLYEGYKHLYIAKHFLEKNGKTVEHEDFPKLKSKLESSRTKLNEIFRNSRAEFFTHRKAGNHQKMADELEFLLEKFPDPTAREHQWAKKKKRKMQEKGNYPTEF